MRISIATVLRSIAAAVPQFPFSKRLQDLMKTIGGRAWRKMSVEELYNAIKTTAEEVKGHGLSEDAYDKFISALDAAGSSKERMISLTTQYLLAGAGLKTVKASLEIKEIYRLNYDKPFNIK